MKMPKGEVTQKDLYDGLLEIRAVLDVRMKEIREMFSSFKRDELDPLNRRIDELNKTQVEQGKKIDRLWWQFGTVATLAFIIFEILIRKFIDGIFK